MEITSKGVDGKKLSNGEIIKIREGFVIGDVDNANKSDNKIVENVLSLKHKGTLLLRITIPFFDDLDQSVVDLAFIKMNFTSAVWTEFYAAGTDMWDESLAEYCTVTKDGDKYTLEMAGTPYIELTAANGEYTATYSENSYKFKKA